MGTEKLRNPDSGPVCADHDEVEVVGWLRETSWRRRRGGVELRRGLGIVLYGKEFYLFYLIIITFRFCVTLKNIVLFFFFFLIDGTRVCFYSSADKLLVIVGR